MINNKYFLMISIIGILLLLVLPFILIYPDIFTTPDENVNFFFINLYRNYGSLTYHEKLNNNDNFNIIIPRGIIPIYGQSVSIFSNGIALLFGSLIIIDYNILYILSLVIILLLVLYYYMFLNLFFSKKISLISSIFVLIFPPFWYNAVRYVTLDLVMMFFLMAGLYYLIGSINDNNFNLVLLSSFFTSISLLINIKAMFFIFAILISSFFVNIRQQNTKKNINLKLCHLIKYGLLILFFSLPIFILNFNLYRNIFLFGYGAQSLYSSSVGGINLPLLFFIPSQMLNNFLLYVVGINLVIFIFSIFGIIIFLKYSNGLNNKFYLVVMITYFIITVLYFSNIAVTWSNTFAIGASFIRYLIPFYLLIIPIAINSISNNLLKSKFISVLIIFVLIISSFLIALTSNQGLLDLYNYKIHSNELRNKILNNTEKESIIFTEYYDKIIFPYRMVATTSYLPGVMVDGNWFENTELLGSIINKMIYNSNIEVYIINDGSLEWNSLVNYLSNQKLYLKEKIKLTDNISLYGVIKNG